MIFNILTIIERALLMLILAKVILSYFMDPFHPFRRIVDQIVDPLLDPIRRILPTLGGIDFSPIVLMILIEIVFSLIRNILI
jgi:YggT family protein